jgi:hypothetical protein
MLTKAVVNKLVRTYNRFVGYTEKLLKDENLLEAAIKKAKTSEDQNAIIVFREAVLDIHAFINVKLEEIEKMIPEDVAAREEEMLNEPQSESNLLKDNKKI